MNELETIMINRLFDTHGKIKSPNCAICQKPVDEFEVTFKAIRQKFVFKIKCHGDSGEIRLHEQYALDPKYKMEINDAFIPDLTNRVDGVQIQEVEPQ